jgi:FkbM family methyltransferase
MKNYSQAVFYFLKTKILFRFKITKYISPYILAFKIYNKGFRKLKISYFNILNFILFSESNLLERKYQTSLFGKKIQVFNSAEWYFHSIEELFLDEVYKCNFKRDNPLIIDCGSNIGLSILYFKYRYPNSKIIAFEPDIENFQRLIKNLSIFNLQNVNPLNFGVWNENKLLKFYPDGNLGGTIKERESNHLALNVQASFVRLKDYITEEIDFLKIDIEGAEYEVLKDIKDNLNKVNNLFLEYHAYANQKQNLQDILSWLSDAGFRYHIKSAWENQKHPFVEQRRTGWDMQLNIYCYRL